MVPEGGNWKSLPPEVLKGRYGRCIRIWWRQGWFLSEIVLFAAFSYRCYKSYPKSHNDVPPTKDRPLSVAEYARIQQFPDNWTLTGTTIDKYRQIGNAVPVGLAKAIGDAIVSVCRGDFNHSGQKSAWYSHSRKNTRTLFK